VKDAADSLRLEAKESFTSYSQLDTDTLVLVLSGAYKDRLGPYDTEAEAARALEKVKERNEEWDNDPKWNDNVED